jgi:tRNA1Val (adenine37-N6)-methyltransferase
MGQSWFQFKKFKINQEYCAQKVGTLSCILGALVHHPAPNKILDIGTGTGLLALMMAQRFSATVVDAVEIDFNTVRQARQNFFNSPWNSQLRLFHQDILTYQPDESYDLIIANPPFYKGHQKTGQNHVNLARHSLALHFLQLGPWIARHLSQDGKGWILLPPREMEQMVTEFQIHSLEVEEMHHIFIHPQSTEKARIACFSRNVSVVRHKTFYIHEPTGAYSAPFKDLLKNFYLNL